MAAELLIGVDGGGTSCRARLCDLDGQVLGEGISGAANARLGAEVSWSAILAAVDSALAQAGLDRSALPRISLGMGLAGIEKAEDGARMAAQAPPFARVIAANDAHTACLGAYGGGDGGIVISGTGSAGYVIARGQGTCIGGWGFTVSDSGSGADIGRESVRSALLAHDGMISGSDFTIDILNRLGGSPPHVVDWVGTARPGDFARLAPLALTAAEAGDPVAVRLIDAAGMAIAGIGRRLQQLGAERLCLLGGLAGPLRPWLPADILACLVPAAGDAMDGALLLARRPSLASGEFP
jgi:glucosamine kinase